MARFEGIYPVLYAFFDDVGRLDTTAMRRQVEYCIDAGCHGIAVLGLVTEVHKLSLPERLELVEIVGEAIGGRVPYAVTTAEPSISGQIDFSRKARTMGADWVILQPPMVKGVSEAELAGFFGAVADALDLPVAIQNNPVNLDVALSTQTLIDLVDSHPAISILKAEGPAIEVEKVAAATQGKADIFSGRGGLELISTLRSGGAGCIPAPDCLEVHVRIFDLMKRGDAASVAEAERLHREVLPLAVFMSHGVEHMLCYGKQLAGGVMGIGNTRPRAPRAKPTPFGMAELERIAGAIDRTI